MATTPEVLPAVRETTMSPPSEAEVERYRALVKAIQGTPTVPEVYRNKPNDIYAAILTGRELGLPPMRALNLIHIIQGRATLSAEAMTLLAQREGHKIEGTSDAKKAHVIGTRGDNAATMEVTFTIEEATAAGLTSKDVWKKYTADMLWARAVSRLCRRLFADVIGGAHYSVEEIRDESVPAEHIDAPALEVKEDEDGNLELAVEGA